jgi:hypothetical protein
MMASIEAKVKQYTTLSEDAFASTTAITIGSKPIAKFYTAFMTPYAIPFGCFNNSQ